MSVMEKWACVRCGEDTLDPGLCTDCGEDDYQQEGDLDRLVGYANALTNVGHPEMRTEWGRTRLAEAVADLNELVAYLTTGAGDD